MTHFFLLQQELVSDVFVEVGVGLVFGFYRSVCVHGEHACGADGDGLVVVATVRAGNLLVRLAEYIVC